MKKILLLLSLLLLLLINHASSDTSGTKYKLRSNLKKELKISGSLAMQGDLDMANYDILNGGDVDFDAISTESVTVSDLTPTRVIFAGIGGLLSDDADLAFITDTLSVTNLTSSGTGTFGQIIDNGLNASSLVWTDASKQLTSTPSWPTSGQLGYWSRTATTLSPASSGDDVSIDGDLFVPTELGGIHGLVLGANKLGYMKIFSSDDMYIGNRNPGKSVIFDVRDSGNVGRVPLSFNTDFLNITRTGTSNDSIATTARLFYQLSSGSGLAGIGSAFSMRTQAGAVTGVNTGYFGGRLDNVGSGTEIGTMTISPDYHNSATYSLDREFSVASVAADEILVSMTKGNLIVTDGRVRIGDSTSPTNELEVNGSSILGDGGTTDYTEVSATGNVTLPAGAAGAGRAPIKFQDGVAQTTPEAGTINYYDDKFCIVNVATCKAIDRTSDVLTSTVEAVNTTTETTIFTAPIAANAVRAGNVQKFKASGQISSVSAADICTIRIKAGGNTISTISSPGKNLSDACWQIDAFTTIRTIGSSGTAATNIKMEAEDNTTKFCSGNVSIDTTGALDITVTAQWNNAKAGNTINIVQGWLEYKN